MFSFSRRRQYDPNRAFLASHPIRCGATSERLAGISPNQGWDLIDLSRARISAYDGGSALRPPNDHPNFRKASSPNCLVFLIHRSSSDISVGATFGEALYIPHPTGIVIRGECKVGNNVTINQNVTIGRAYERRGYDQDNESFTLIGDGARIYAGAVILGPVRVGTNAKIGANAVVLRDIPDNALAVGVPAQIIMKEGL